MLSNLVVNYCSLLILTAFVPSCTVWIIFHAVWATSTFEILLNSSIETTLKIAFMALLLKAAASFWEVDHSLIEVVSFSRSYSTKFHIYPLINRFQECFHPYFLVGIIVSIKVRWDHKRVTVLHDNRGQGLTFRSKDLTTQELTCFDTTCRF